MSGIKRMLKETDPDYEDVSVALPNKRHKAIESSGRNSDTWAITYFCVGTCLPVRFIGAKVKCISTVLYNSKRFVSGIN